MNFLIRLIVTLSVCAVAIGIMYSCMRFVTNRIVISFLTHIKLIDVVIEKKLKLNNKEERYDVFIRFQDEPNNTYKIFFESSVFVYILYKLRIGTLSNIKINISAYDKISGSPISSLEEANYLKYDGRYCIDDKK